MRSDIQKKTSVTYLTEIPSTFPIKWGGWSRLAITTKLRTDDAVVDAVAVTAAAATDDDVDNDGGGVTGAGTRLGPRGTRFSRYTHGLPQRELRTDVYRTGENLPLGGGQ